MQKWGGIGEDKADKGRDYFSGKGTNFSEQEAGVPGVGVPWVVESVPVGGVRFEELRVTSACWRR